MNSLRDLTVFFRYILSNVSNMATLSGNNNVMWAISVWLALASPDGTLMTNHAETIEWLSDWAFVMLNFIPNKLALKIRAERGTLFLKP